MYIHKRDNRNKNLGARFDVTRGRAAEFNKNNFNKSEKDILFERYMILFFREVKTLAGLHIFLINLT
jgi:hypothetical protein